MDRVAATERAAHLDPYDITALGHRHHDRRIAGNRSRTRAHGSLTGFYIRPVESTPATSAIRCDSA